MQHNSLFQLMQYNLAILLLACICVLYVYFNRLWSFCALHIYYQCLETAASIHLSDWGGKMWKMATTKNWRALARKFAISDFSQEWKLLYLCVRFDGFCGAWQCFLLIIKLSKLLGGNYMFAPPPQYFHAAPPPPRIDASVLKRLTNLAGVCFRIVISTFCAILTCHACLIKEK